MVELHGEHCPPEKVGDSRLAYCVVVISRDCILVILSNAHGQLVNVAGKASNLVEMGFAIKRFACSMACDVSSNLTSTALCRRFT